MPQDIKRFMSGVYRFQLEGQLIPTQIARIDARQLGSAYDLSFVVESGVPVRFQVVDDLGSAVEGAGCRLVWFDALRGAYEVTSSVLLTDATGDVVFTTAKNTSVFLSCSKAGHAYVEAGPVVGPMDSPLTVTLPRAGLIRGRVTFQGANVERFSIVHYQGDGWGQYAPIAFSDRADGTFELDEAPVGEVELFALAPGYGQSIPVTVEVKSGEVTEVELKLQSGSEGRGRVLDAETRAPIAGLEVLRPARSANDVIGMEVDNPIATELDGRFVVNGLIGPNTRVGFRAEGYPASEAIASVGTRLQELMHPRFKSKSVARSMPAPCRSPRRVNSKCLGLCPVTSIWISRGRAALIRQRGFCVARGLGRQLSTFRGPTACGFLWVVFLMI